MKSKITLILLVVGCLISTAGSQANHPRLDNLDVVNDSSHYHNFSVKLDSFVRCTEQLNVKINKHESNNSD